MPWAEELHCPGMRFLGALWPRSLVANVKTSNSPKKEEFINMKKRIISSIMCLAMLLSLLPVAAFAAEPGDTIDVAVTEVGAFPTAEAFKSYVNNRYY